MGGGDRCLLPLSSRLTVGHEVVMTDWEVEENGLHCHRGVNPGELLAEVVHVGEEIDEGSKDHDPMWVGTQHIVPVRGQLCCFHQLRGCWAG